MRILNFVARPLFDLLTVWTLCCAYVSFIQGNFKLMLSISLIYLVSSMALGLNRVSWRYYSLADYIKLSFIVALSFSPVLINQSPKLYLYVQLVIGINSFLLCTRMLRNLVYRDEKKMPAKRVIVIGAQRESVALANALRTQGSEVLGLFDERGNGFIRNSFRVFGKFDDLTQLHKSKHIDSMVVPYSFKGKKLQALMQFCFDEQIQLKRASLNFEEARSCLQDFSLAELLGRDNVDVDLTDLDKRVESKNIVVTGAGGSIGSELSRQLSSMQFNKLILIDNCEYNLFAIQKELEKKNVQNVIPVLGDIKDKKQIEKCFSNYKPDFIFHAAAYKHVHLVELNPYAAILNNILGTRNLLELSRQFDVENFLLVSTDKAVNPTSIMGATKRICEILVTKESTLNKGRYLSVRFGNVLGSSGSLIPILKGQIKEGGPLTITDPEMKRFFMSIPEAVGLVLKAMCISNNGSVNILKMGEPVKIVDIAKRLIYLSGKSENEVPIIFTGKKPGEKLYEELYLCGDEVLTDHPDIVCLPDGDCTNLLDSETKNNRLETSISQIIQWAQTNDHEAIELLETLINLSNRKINANNNFNVELQRSA